VEQSCDEELLLQSSIEERNWLSPNPLIKLVPASISVLFVPRRKIIRSSNQSPFTILSSLGSNPETAVGFAKRSDPKTGGEREDGSRTEKIACRLWEGERRPVISPAGRHLGPSKSRSKAENVALNPSLRGVTLTPPVDPSQA
jgi:hypothetical protein